MKKLGSLIPSPNKTAEAGLEIRLSRGVASPTEHAVLKSLAR
jgi:hypothetical protein